MPLSLNDAVRAALAGQPQLAAGAALAAADRAAADSSEVAWLPTVTLSAQALATDDPLAVLGAKLEERSVSAATFTPGSLNEPGFIADVGLGAEAQMPLFTSGRIEGSRLAAIAQARASGLQQAFDRQALSVRVVEAYFRAELGDRAVLSAKDEVTQALETERFVKARVAQDLLLPADRDRTAAYRAEAEAHLVTIAQDRDDARADLALLCGETARSAELVTPVDTTAAAEPRPIVRADLQASRAREEAARAGVEVAKSQGGPQVGLQARGGALWGGGTALGAFVTVGLAARFDLLSPTSPGLARAAAQTAIAAAEASRWKELQATAETERLRRSVAAADARVGANQEALTASESARRLRQARHQQGLLPLTDLLDAQTASTRARTSLFQAQLEASVGRARLRLATGQPVEGTDQ